MEYDIFEQKMNKNIEFLEENLMKTRAGRANPAILDNIKIDYYGVPTPIEQVARISVPEARVIVIQPWENTLLKTIEKEILKSDIGITPNNDGKIIRLCFPELNEERRKELVKQIRKIAEETKVSIRGVRREAIEHFKSRQKESIITEDELKVAENEIQKITDKKVSIVEEILSKKEKEIMLV